MSSSNSISFNGRQYKKAEIMSEMVSLAKQLASNAHLLADSPLPADTDLSESEQTEVQNQIAAMLILPPDALIIFWDAFAANHLNDIAVSLRRLSHTTQPHAVSTAIQILSLIPEPAEQDRHPYFRKFLRNSTAVKDVPNIVADAFVKGMTLKKPSGPGRHCTLIINTLFWCDTSLGDDGRASVDAGIRAALANAIQATLDHPRSAELDRMQRVEMERLKGILLTINMEELGPGGYFLKSTREHLEGRFDMCSGNDCDEDAELSCSKCKTVRYCGAECQSWHWKHGHRARCFQTDY
ncbi:hypothetical protein R3P38DRAFT_2899366 [Favolaschia claudopus]|uniref:MYND-type domain-containing protein n=1 Tax=Favolaschia claudopus TaxID=2862362 RepID=A0AAW0CLE9_9AGAR